MYVYVNLCLSDYLAKKGMVWSIKCFSCLGTSLSSKCEQASQKWALYGKGGEKERKRVRKINEECADPINTGFDHQYWRTGKRAIYAYWRHHYTQKLYGRVFVQPLLDQCHLLIRFHASIIIIVCKLSETYEVISGKWPNGPNFDHFGNFEPN